MEVVPLSALPQGCSDEGHLFLEGGTVRWKRCPRAALMRVICSWKVTLSDGSRPSQCVAPGCSDEGHLFLEGDTVRWKSSLLVRCPRATLMRVICSWKVTLSDGGRPSQSVAPSLASSSAFSLSEGPQWDGAPCTTAGLCCPTS